MEGYQVVRLDDVVREIDIVITTTGNKGIVSKAQMSKMKNNCIVGNIGHFDNEIDMKGLTQDASITRVNIKPQVDRFVFEDGHGIIMLAEGRLLNLGCATGHPSFVMSCSFTNQVVAQLELWKERNSKKYDRKVYVLPKHLDEKVARLHLAKLGARLTELTPEQAKYIGGTSRDLTNPPLIAINSLHLSKRQCMFSLARKYIFGSKNGRPFKKRPCDSCDAKKFFRWKIWVSSVVHQSVYIGLKSEENLLVHIANNYTRQACSPP